MVAAYSKTAMHWNGAPVAYSFSIYMVTGVVKYPSHRVDGAAIVKFWNG